MDYTNIFIQRCLAKISLYIFLVSVNELLKINTNTLNK